MEFCDIISTSVIYLQSGSLEAIGSAPVHRRLRLKSEDRHVSINDAVPTYICNQKGKREACVGNRNISAGGGGVA
jgi:hypothetical protein